MVVQRWDETISSVATQDLAKEEHAQLEKAVLMDNILDQEILAMLQRWPSIFHMGMLPSCSSGQLSVDEAAKAVATAHKEAATSQLKVFEAELLADWATIARMHSGHAALRELLQWLTLEHRRGQAATAEALVARRLAKHHPMVEIASWQHLAGQLSLVLKSSETPAGVRRLVMVIDFNTPGSRDTLKQSAMISAMASAAKVVGAEHSLVLAIMPNTAKEGSTTTPEEDEYQLSLLFIKAGFKQQVRFVQVFKLHESVANKTSEMDWFTVGRLLALGDVGENELLRSSELARIRRVMAECTLPLVRDLVNITSLDENSDINISSLQADVAFKCAQRGPAVC